MIQQFLKMGGASSIEEFYQKFPTEEHFNEYVKKKYGGGINAYQDGGAPPKRGDYMDNEEQYQADMDAYIASQGTYAMPAVGKDGMTDFIRRSTESSAVPVVTTTASSTSTPSSKLKDYQGASVYDFLTAQGKAGDYQSRKQLAKTLGISNYTGSAKQNAQMMEMIRQNSNVLEGYTASQKVAQPTTSKSKVVKRSANKQQPILNDDNEYFDDFADYEADRQANSNPYITGYIGRHTYRGTPIEPFQASYNARRGDYVDIDLGSGYYKSDLSKIKFDQYQPWQGATPSYTGVDSKNPIEGVEKDKAIYNKAFKFFTESVKRGEKPYVPRELKYYLANKIWNNALNDFKQQTGYKQGGSFNPGTYSDGYSGTYSNGVYFGEGGAFIPSFADYSQGLPQFGMGKAMYGLGMERGGSIPGQTLRNFKKGSVHDLSDQDVQELINQGYTIEYL